MNVVPLLVAAALPALSASLDTTATSVGGRLTMRMVVDAPPEWVVEPPALPAELGAFRVRSVHAAGGGADSTRGFDVSLVPVEAGRLEIPPVTVRARQGSDPPVELTSPPLVVDVSSNLAPSGGEADSATSAQAEPAPLKPALDAPRDWRPVWIATLAAALAAALGFVALRHLRKLRARTGPAASPRVPPEPPRPAWEIALEELDRIVAARWVERGELRRQYDEVTEALRRYLENRWGVAALESTTDDLRRLFPRSSVPPEIAGRVLGLLAEADLVKFAKARPPVDAARSSETRARAVVLETMPREEPKEAVA